MEDHNNKNKDTKKEKNRDVHYDSWRVLQGREDAEMLLEKSEHWSSKKASRGDYDEYDE